MKMRKKIGLTVLILAVMAVCGTEGLMNAGLPQDKMGESENIIEQDKATAPRTVDMISERTNQSGETPSSDSEINPDIELIDLEDYSDVPADNGCPYYVKVNRQRNVVTVYTLDEAGYYTRPVRAMLCSVGKNDWTPTGTFQTSDRYSWCALAGGVYGQYAYRISGPIMFHSVPYYTRNKDDLETKEYNKLGEAASLGCVRLSVLDAKWIFDNCPVGTIVTIYDSEYAGPLGVPVAEILDVEDERSCWDPTDPDIENPWNNGKPRLFCTDERIIERGYTWQQTCGILALDGQGNDITDQITVEGKVDVMTPGDYPVTYRVKDKEGNTASVQSMIRVKDTIAPELIVDEQSIILNRAETSIFNCKAAIVKHITVLDAGEELDSDCLILDTDSLAEKSSGKYSISVYAVDDSGNHSESHMLTISIDREAPIIQEPEQKRFQVSSDADLEEQLLKAIQVEDDYSGVEDVRISWVHEGSDIYTVLVTAKDRYGNVNSSFLNDFIISYENGE